MGVRAARPAAHGYGVIGLISAALRLASSSLPAASRTPCPAEAGLRRRGHRCGPRHDPQASRIRGCG